MSFLHDIGTVNMRIRWLQFVLKSCLTYSWKPPWSLLASELMCGLFWCQNFFLSSLWHHPKCVRLGLMNDLLLGGAQRSQSPKYSSILMPNHRRQGHILCISLERCKQGLCIYSTVYIHTPVYTWLLHVSCIFVKLYVPVLTLLVKFISAYVKSNCYMHVICKSAHNTWQPTFSVASF